MRLQDELCSKNCRRSSDIIWFEEFVFFFFIFFISQKRGESYLHKESSESFGSLGIFSSRTGSRDMPNMADPSGVIQQIDMSKTFFCRWRPIAFRRRKFLGKYCVRRKMVSKQESSQKSIFFTGWNRFDLHKTCIGLLGFWKFTYAAIFRLI